jgi:hypothetical protein
MWCGGSGGAVAVVAVGVCWLSLTPCCVVAAKQQQKHTLLGHSGNRVLAKTAAARTIAPSCFNLSFSYENSSNGGRPYADLQRSVNYTRLVCQEGFFCWFGNTTTNPYPMELFIRNDEPDAEKYMAQGWGCEPDIVIVEEINCDERAYPIIPSCVGGKANVALKNLTFDGTQSCSEVIASMNLKFAEDTSEQDEECACCGYFPTETTAVPTAAAERSNDSTGEATKACANASSYSYKDANNYNISGSDDETTQLELSLNVSRLECQEGFWCLVDHSSSQQQPLQGNWTKEDLMQRTFIANDDPNAKDLMARAVTDSCQADVTIWINLNCDAHRTDDRSMPTCLGDHVNVALQNLTLDGTQTCDEVAIAARLKLGLDMTDFNEECACTMQIINLTATTTMTTTTAPTAAAAAAAAAAATNAWAQVAVSASTAAAAAESLVWTGFLPTRTITTLMLLLGVCVSG